MARQLSIHPVTRLEGHGKIDIFLDDSGEVDRASFMVPEFRGFEKFCEGRAAEEMPTLTQKICGVCPTAHHTASTKALDDLFGVKPPPAATLIRELIYNAFIFEDHLLHFFIMSGPDFLVGPEAPRGERNVFGVIRKIGEETVRKVIWMRKRVREMVGRLGGSAVQPVFGLPGGVSRAVTEEDRKAIKALASEAVAFARFSLAIFGEIVLENHDYTRLLLDETYLEETHYMGMVDKQNRVNFYDGEMRVVDREGRETARFAGRDYLDHLEEGVEPGTFLKPLHLKAASTDGQGRVYRVAPLARLNAAEGMATPLAHEEYERFYRFFGAKPVHYTLAYHWARLIEVLYAAERMAELARAPGLTDPKVRRLPDVAPSEGVGVCEAPRGTLIHHYETDAKGILRKVNLIVGTQNNAAAICLSVEKAARALIRGGVASDGLLNRVEMAFRAYDPCLACATHAVGNQGFSAITIRDGQGRVIESR